MSGKLVNIPCSEWPDLRDQYLRDWPLHMVGYYTLDNFCRWISKQSDIRDLYLYSLNGDWSDGTFLAVDRYQLFVNSLQSSNERLTIAVGLLDWSRGLKVSTFLDRHRPAILNSVKSKNLSTEFDSKTSVYFLPRKDAAQLDYVIPSGYRLGKILKEHAVSIEAVWPNRHTGSLFFVERILAWNEQIGVFSEDSGQLVAWCLRLQAGPLGVFQVDANHMKKGLGSLVLSAISKQMGLKDMDVFACVNVDNVPSRKTFEKVGFKVVDECGWLRTFPFDRSFSWVDTTTLDDSFTVMNGVELQ